MTIKSRDCQGRERNESNGEMASQGSVADAQEEDSAISGMSFEESATVPGDAIDPQQTGQRIVQDPPPPVHEQHLPRFSQEASSSQEASLLQPSEQPRVPTTNGGYNGTTTGGYIAPPPYTPRPSIPAQESGGFDPVNPRMIEDLTDQITELSTENRDLNELLSLKTEEAKALQKCVSDVTAEKTDTEQQLENMKETFKRVEKGNKKEIEGLKSLLEEKEQYIEKLKNEKADQERNLAEAKQQYEEDVAKLKKKIETLTREQLEKHISYLREKHELEKQLKDCQTNEERLLKNIAVAEKDAQYYKAKLAEEKQKQLEDELAKERRHSELKEQEIRQLKQLSPSP